MDVQQLPERPMIIAFFLSLLAIPVACGFFYGLNFLNRVLASDPEEDWQDDPSTIFVDIWYYLPVNCGLEAELEKLALHYQGQIFSAGAGLGARDLGFIFPSITLAKQFEAECWSLPGVKVA